MRVRLLHLTVLASFVSVSSSPAQAPPAEPKIWTDAMSAGLALTSGNTDTSTVNAAYDLVYDPQTKNVVKSDALFLRGKTEGELSANRLGLTPSQRTALSWS